MTDKPIRLREFMMRSLLQRRLGSFPRQQCPKMGAHSVSLLTQLPENLTVEGECRAVIWRWSLSSLRCRTGPSAAALCGLSCHNRGNESLLYWVRSEKSVEREECGNEKNIDVHGVPGSGLLAVCGGGRHEIEIQGRDRRPSGLGRCAGRPDTGDGARRRERESEYSSRRSTRRPDLGDRQARCQGERWRAYHG